MRKQRTQSYLLRFDYYAQFSDYNYVSIDWLRSLIITTRVLKTSPGCSNFEYARPSMLEKTSMLESAREKSSCSSATRVLVAVSLHLRRLFSQAHSLAPYLFSHSQACKCGRRRQRRRNCMQMRGRRGQRGAQMYANACISSRCSGGRPFT